MLTTVDQLEVGDEFILPVMSDLRYYRVEKKPEPKKGSPVNRWTQRVMYKGVRCSYHLQKKVYPSGHEVMTYGFCPEDHNQHRNVDLNYKQIWLIKKG